MFQIPTSFLSPFSGGNWVLLHSGIGISAMHMQLLNNNKVVIFDRTDFGPSNLSLPAGKCRNDQNDVALKNDCTAHSLVYDIATNTFRPLTVQTDTWCSSGSVSPDGTLIQTGGYNDGERVIRTFSPCDDDQCDWTELKSEYLSVRRWYATNQILPDARIIIVGGRNVFNYEFYPKDTAGSASSSPANYYMQFLKETRDAKEENNLYPFLHLLPDGNLFVFANRRSISFDYKRNRVVREFPAIPGDKRNYPSTGSSVLLPLILSGSKGTQSPEAEVLVCGGAPAGSFPKAEKGNYVTASKTCGRIKVTDPQPEWAMEDMPMPRVMPDILLLPTGDVIIINGASRGTAGWEDATDAVLNPVLYSTYEPNPTRRFTQLNPSTIPRMYHSSAVLLPDGRILVGGSNPHRAYNFTSYPYPTELSLEAFSPHYLAPLFSHLRPSILSVEIEGKTVSYGQVFSVTFGLTMYHPDLGITVHMMTPSFTTHSVAMNQRMLVLNVAEVVQLSLFAYKVVVSGPTAAEVAPPGYYMLFVVHAGTPSHAVWVKVQ
ncbi:hypothetical protein L1049_006878 [Liquidambar formosana]|uniref:Galactose oxidase n=1 Tax=Liquidambar formosana TaxID=63359 RepID=A0AAP0RHQ2_LIQFO